MSSTEMALQEEKELGGRGPAKTFQEKAEHEKRLGVALKMGKGLCS